MKRSDQDKLFGQVFAGDKLSEIRQRSLEAGLASMRRRRRRRRVLRGCAVLFLPVVLAVWLMIERAPAPSPDLALAAIDGPVAAKTSPPEPVASGSGIKIITDEELLALFPDRPRALVGRPGEQRLIIGDQIRDPEPEDRN